MERRKCPSLECISGATYEAYVRSFSTSASTVTLASSLNESTIDDSSDNYHADFLSMILNHIFKGGIGYLMFFC